MPTARVVVFQRSLASHPLCSVPRGFCSGIRAAQEGRAAHLIKGLLVHQATGHGATAVDGKTRTRKRCVTVTCPGRGRSVRLSSLNIFRSHLILCALICFPHFAMSVVVEATEILELSLNHSISKGSVFDQLVDALMNTLGVYQLAERPQPVYAGHLTAEKSRRILAPVDSKSPRGLGAPFLKSQSPVGTARHSHPIQNSDAHQRGARGDRVRSTLPSWDGLGVLTVTARNCRFAFFNDWRSARSTTV